MPVGLRILVAMAVKGAKNSTETANEPGRRRPLWFERLDDILTEANRLAAAEQGGTLVQNGNWTLGQILGHLAGWMNFAFDGYPREIHAPLPVRLILKLFQKRILTGGMMAGVKIRGTKDGTVANEIIPTDEGLRRLGPAIERLKAQSPVILNPAFGHLTHDEWIALNLRHAELHLGFLDTTG